MTNIKRRLKDAYDSVIFYANKTWTNDNYLYHKANQELYARYVKIQETFAEEVTRPRTVRDSIPNSKLAQYSNYKYDESRELSYTPIGPDVVFHYPCQLKQMNANEPWMLPEVEQLFIWLTYSPTFNLTQYMDLADYNHTETYDLARNFCNDDEDLHVINPRRYEDFERTPGKPRFTKYDYLFEIDSKMIVPPPVLNFNSFEDMTVKMKFDVDAIKNIWKTNRCEEMGPNKKLQVYKSPFDNIFIDETSSSSQKFLHYPEYFNVERNPYHFNELQEKASDFRNLQNLTDVLKKIKDSDVITTANRNTKVTSSIVPMRSETECAANTPARRLYSDVVQGVASNNKPSTSKSHVNLDSSPPLAHTSSCKDIQFGNLDEGISSTSSYKYIPPKTRPSSPSTSWLDQLRGKQDSRMFLKHDDGRKAECSQTKISNSSHTSSTQTKSFPTSSLFSESLSNSPITCYNNFPSSGYPNCVQNAFGSSDYQPSDLQAAFHAFHNQNLQNAYQGNYFGNTPYQYPQGNLYCNNFTTGNYPSNHYSYPTTSFPNPLTTTAAAARSFVQQQQQQQQQQQNQNSLHYNSGQWVINQIRSPSVFNVAHFPPQPYFLLPSHFPKQRWLHYMRQPPTPQAYQLNATTPPHPPSSNQQPQAVPVSQMQQQVSPQTIQQLQQNWSGVVQQSHQQSNQTSQSVFKTTSTQHIVAASYNAFEGSSSSMHNLDLSTKQKLKSRKINSQVNLAFKTVRSKSPDVKSSSTTSKRSSITSEGSCAGEVLDSSNNNGNLMKVSQEQQQKQRVEKDVGMIVADDSNKGKGIIIQKNSSEGKKIFSNSSTVMTRDYESEIHSLPVTATASEELERQALDEYESSNESFYKELERQAEEQYEDSENRFGPPNDLEFDNKSFFGGLCANYYYLMMVCYIYHYA
ncbi:uncharacterized protein [Onthophagus taurus]|uniref:uncharacterized protein isoform X1 n=1 Tax=Onthophagus taurus TaxID=166361 RepID=UPI0039BDE6ED